MEKKDNGLKVAVVAALIISLVAVGVGFAAFSTTLTIEGTATVKNSTWDVHFSQIVRNSSSTEGIGLTLPTITNNTSAGSNTNQTLINAFDVTFTKPNQKVIYDITVLNAGSYDASLSAYTLGTKNCTGKEDATTATTDATNVCNNTTFTLTYEDGSAIETGATLAAGATAQLKLTVEYVDITDASLLPKDEVTVSLGTTTLTYSQK